MLVNEVQLTLVSLLVFGASKSVSSTSNMNVTNSPYTVMVLFTNSKQFCSGVIIEASWVLTAAHCLFDLDGNIVEKKKTIIILAGTNSLEEAHHDITSGQAQIRSIKDIKIFPDYIWLQKFVDDIAVLQVAEPFTLSDRVKVAVLQLNITEAKSAQDAVVVSVDHHGEEASWQCTVRGYGKAFDREEYGRIKRIEYVVNKHCHCLEWIRSYKSPVDIMRQRNIFVCDKQDLPLKKRKSVCAGDNGAPLMCNGFLRGIVSTIFYYKSDNCKTVDNYGQVKCGTKHFMNVYTDVCYFSEWLHQVVKSFPLLDETCEAVKMSNGSMKSYGTNGGLNYDW